MDTALPIAHLARHRPLAHDRQQSTALVRRWSAPSWSPELLSWTFNFVRQWFTARVVGDVVLQLRQDAFEAVMERDMSFYDEFPSGKIVSRVTSDTEDFSTVVTLTLNLLSQVLLVVLIARRALFASTCAWRC